jgi:hypothetical protein
MENWMSNKLGRSHLTACGSFWRICGLSPWACHFQWIFA